MLVRTKYLFFILVALVFSIRCSKYQKPYQDQPLVSPSGKYILTGPGTKRSASGWKTQSSAESIEDILRHKGAPDICYVMSGNPDIDAREMPLTEALPKTIGMDTGTLVSCIPGKLAYFEMEAFDGRYILER